MEKKIGIELNHIIRDINSQIIKYYKKDIDHNFDETLIDLKSMNLLDKLNFKCKKERYNFLYVDYPYEIFGCAKVTARNLINSINEWNILMNDLDDGNEYEIIHFSNMENELTIQSTYYFLSKIGSRVRKMIFPKNKTTIWDECDVVITCDKDIVNAKPDNKIVMFIDLGQNFKSKKIDYRYDNLLDVIKDKDFIDKINFKYIRKKFNLIEKIKKIIKK